MKLKNFVKFPGEDADSLTVLIGEHNWSPKNNLKVAINEAHADFCDQGCG